VTIVTSAPTRIDLAGGTIDIWPLYLFHPGAQTINAAISLRAQARITTRPDECIVIQSEDTATTVEVDRWQDLRNERRLRLLSLLVHFFEGHGITLTTTSDSPAGAGIAGSSALNVAVCAALADWRRTHYEPEALLQIASRQAEVRELVVNRWIQLASVDPDTGAMHIFTDAGFVPYEPDTAGIGRFPNSAARHGMHRDHLTPVLVDAALHAPQSAAA